MLFKHDTVDVRTSLAVGFSGDLPEEWRHMVGKQHRETSSPTDIPFEDRQFDVVIMAGAVIGTEAIKEAHRVLRPSGKLFFRVPAKSGSEGGYELPGLYALLRDGFNITGLESTPRWMFWKRDRTIAVVAEKKNWKPQINRFRPYV